MTYLEDVCDAATERAHRSSSAGGVRFPAPAAIAAAVGTWLGQAIIPNEVEWRRLPFDAHGQPESVIAATRWRSPDVGLGEARDSSCCEWFILGIALQRMDMQLSVDGRMLRDGLAWPGMHYLTVPGARATGRFRGAADWLHIHIPPAFVEACGGGAYGANASDLRSDTRMHRGPGIERLAMALLDSDELDVSVGHAYAGGIATALAGRAIASAVQRCAAGRDSHGNGLPKWRLKRAVDFVEERLTKPLSLADIAAAAGLSRMHFASQFRAAMGVRPREYVLRRRIERAQELLRDSRSPIVEIALTVGFQTQAHFTGVFKRFVGQPPHAWRQAQR